MFRFRNAFDFLFNFLELIDYARIDFHVDEVVRSTVHNFDKVLFRAVLHSLIIYILKNIMYTTQISNKGVTFYFFTSIYYILNILNRHE